MVVAFRLLGSVEALVDGVLVELGPARQRCALVALLVDANEVVPSAQLVERVWGERAPRRARATLRTYLSRLRASLADADGVEIRHRAGGYVIQVDRSAVDLYRFRALTAAAAAAGSEAETRAMLERALGLWRAEAFSGLDSPWLDLLRETVEAERVAAEQNYADLLLRAGEHAELVGRLVGQAARRPLDERVAGQLMLALFHSGRQAEALEIYGRIRSHLAEELGTDPGPGLRELHQRLLAGEPDPAGTSHRPSPVPAMLPVGVRGFTGRARQLARLDEVLAAAGREGTGATAVVSGPGGVGKTALVLHWAHQVTDRFPDGQLFLALRGFDVREPVAADQALRSLLEVLGVAPAAVPLDRDGRVALFRSLTADKRMLIVLDDARDAEQVRPLLPGTPNSVVVVTSRNRLTGLVVSEGAEAVVLDELDPDEARQLLARRIGAGRVAAEPEAAAEIAERCAGLPLAIAIVAAGGATRPDVPLAGLARALAAAGDSLDAFSTDETATDLRTVLSWSYRALRPPTQHLFRLLGLQLGAQFGAGAAASLAGLPQERVRPALTELIGLHLLAGRGPGRYALHALHRAHAHELAEAEDGAADREAAVRRLLDHHLHTAHRAAQALHPHPADPLPAPVPGVTVAELGDPVAAVTWFDLERPTLCAEIERAAAVDADGRAWCLVRALTELLARRGHVGEVLVACRAALDAARCAGDPVGEASVRRVLGRAHAAAARFEDARAQLRRALALVRQLRDRHWQADVHHDFGWVADRVGRYEAALRHHRAALEAYAGTGDRFGQASALTAVGRAQCLLGGAEEALATGHRALAEHQSNGDRQGEGLAWAAVGLADHHLGRHRSALTAYRRSLDLLRRAGDRASEAEVLFQNGETHRVVGDLDEACGAWRRALAVLSDLGHADVRGLRALLDRFGGPCRNHPARGA